MMARVIWYNQGPADPETVYANIPGAGTQTGSSCAAGSVAHATQRSGPCYLCLSSPTGEGFPRQCSPAQNCVTPVRNSAEAQFSLAPIFQLFNQIIVSLRKFLNLYNSYRLSC